MNKSELINMSQDGFEAMLEERFPLLYKDMHGDVMKTCMAFGIETGPGWYPLIYNMSEKLELLIRALKADPEYDNEYLPCAAQVKEKYGTLRFYMTYETYDISEVITEGEGKSHTTCMLCGDDRGKIVDARGWLYTLCDECKAERS